MYYLHKASELKKIGEFKFITGIDTSIPEEFKVFMK